MLCAEDTLLYYYIFPLLRELWIIFSDVVIYIYSCFSSNKFVHFHFVFIWVFIWICELVYYLLVDFSSFRSTVIFHCFSVWENSNKPNPVLVYTFKSCYRQRCTFWVSNSNTCHFRENYSLLVDLELCSLSPCY